MADGEHSDSGITSYRCKFVTLQVTRKTAKIYIVSLQQASHLSRTEFVYDSLDGPFDPAQKVICIFSE